MLGKIAAAALIAGFAAAAQAQPTVPGTGIVATSAWSRATPPGAQTAAVYLTLKSPVQDKLVAVTTPEAKTAEVHQMSMDGAVMIMRALPAGLPLPAGQPVSLQPGGYHIMLTGLKAPLKLNQTIPLHLTFQSSPPIDIVARVAALGATTAPQ